MHKKCSNHINYNSILYRNVPLYWLLHKYLEAETTRHIVVRSFYDSVVRFLCVLNITVLKKIFKHAFPSEQSNEKIKMEICPN